MLIADTDSVVGLAIIGLSALVEYVFPPFPGDTITLFGAVLITRYGWSFTAVFCAVMLGSVAGSMFAFYLGGWLEGRRQLRMRRHHHQNFPQERRAVIDRLIEKFRIHGPTYLIINRFLPGIRALFFVAAGMARMRPLATLAYSAISAALWNLGIIAIGSLLGANLDTLLAGVHRYTIAVWGIFIVSITVIVLRAVARRYRVHHHSSAD